MSDATNAGLRAAARTLALAMRDVAAVRTKEGARAVNVGSDPAVAGEEVVIAAGHARGVYGWEPIQAAMFEGNDRHPLFGDKKHWYNQGYWPITEGTERAGLDDAVEDFADAAVPVFLQDYGFAEE
jgi:hypothetical protein